MSNSVTSRRRGPSPAVAAVASVIPGLGQILTGHVRKGILILASFVSIAFMLDWRLQLLAPDRPNLLQTWADAFGRRPVFLILVVAVTLLAWVMVALEAARNAAQSRAAEVAPPRGRVGILAVILGLFFVLGWQISEIDLVKLVRDLPEAWQPLSKVIWPWQAAFTRPVKTLDAGASVGVPCAPEGVLPAAAAEPGAPTLTVDPNCGVLATLDADNNPVPGTPLHVRGAGFQPNTETELWWIDPLQNAFRMRKSGQYVVFTTDAAGGFVYDITMPYAVVPTNPGEQAVHRIEARQVASVGAVQPSEALLIVISRMVETIFMGMMATFFGIVLSVPISFLASRNLMAHSPITLAIYYVTRFVLNVVRSIEPLIWALIATVWVGLGPFAGIIALTVHSVASLGKLYSEAIEGIDPGPIEAIQATGATRLQTIAYAVVPQMVPPFVSFSIYRWDINVRMSTVIGLVGGGGVGFILVQYIRLLDYRAAGIAVWFIAVTVAVLDYVSSEIRRRFT